MNNIYKNLTDSISNEFKVFNLDEDVQFSISKIDGYDLQINGYICPDIMDSDQLVEKYLDEVKNITADIIWISLGFPKQEMFIDKVCKTIDINSNFVEVMLCLYCKEFLKVMGLLLF